MQRCVTCAATLINADAHPIVLSRKPFMTQKPIKATKHKRASPPVVLADLRNIGPAALSDFAVLGIETLAQLQACDPDVLYQELQLRTAKRHDPCVWDVFAAAIHEAKTGEAQNWWQFTAARKARQASGTFMSTYEAQHAQLLSTD
jgi:nucleotidyltransferase/DNA polymerase involved in DNA repair